MTVEELIIELQSFDNDLSVSITDGEYPSKEIDSVEFVFGECRLNLKD